MKKIVFLTLAEVIEIHADSVMDEEVKEGRKLHPFENLGEPACRGQVLAPSENHNSP